jgi:hypothetical protein
MSMVRVHVLVSVHLSVLVLVLVHIRVQDLLKLIHRNLSPKLTEGSIASLVKEEME